MFKVARFSRPPLSPHCVPFLSRQPPSMPPFFFLYPTLNENLSCFIVRVFNTSPRTLEILSFPHYQTKLVRSTLRPIPLIGFPPLVSAFLRLPPPIYSVPVVQDCPYPDPQLFPDFLLFSSSLPLFFFLLRKYPVIILPLGFANLEKFSCCYSPSAVFPMPLPLFCEARFYSFGAPQVFLL